MVERFPGKNWGKKCCCVLKVLLKPVSKQLFIAFLFGSPTEVGLRWTWQWFNWERPWRWKVQEILFWCQRSLCFRESWVVTGGLKKSQKGNLKKYHFHTCSAFNQQGYSPQKSVVKLIGDCMDWICFLQRNWDGNNTWKLNKKSLSDLSTFDSMTVEWQRSGNWQLEGCLMTGRGDGPPWQLRVRRKMVNIENGRKHFSGQVDFTTPKYWNQLEGWLLTVVGRWWVSVLPQSREQVLRKPPPLQLTPNTPLQSS